MSLNPGTRLGPYEIVAQIGSGGMGEVYRARDTRLDRTVAVKVLSADLTSSAPLRARFEREAKAISALSHPNICTLFDVGQVGDDSTMFLVMELLEGETLADRLSRGPLPADEALRCAIEIAGALDRAHRGGIVHRDLKPGNIMLTRSGAKLLDFGLAKSASAVSGTLGGPTEIKPITEEGAVLGTFQYMAPEQVEGLAADARTDIFAFGVVLYEMLTGKRAFEGKSRASLIAAILAVDPRPVSLVQPLTPVALDRVVQLCLRKDPEERWQSIYDVKLELERLRSSAPEAVSAASARGRWAGWIAAATIAAVAAGWILVDRKRNQVPAPSPVRFEIAPPPAMQFDAANGPAVFSPDGKRVAMMISGSKGRDLIWLRSLDSEEFKPIAGTEGGYDHFWSPDSRYLGFFVDGKLRKVDLSTSSVTTICETSDSRGGTWSEDGVILFSAAAIGPLYRVADTGGKPVAVTKLDSARKETAHWRPHFLPGGRKFLYMTLSEMNEEAGVFLGSLDSPEVRKVLPFATPAAFVEPDRILYLNQSDLYSQPFDPDTAKTTGDGTVVARGIHYTDRYASPGFSVSKTGNLLFHRRPENSDVALLKMPIDGEVQTVLPVDGVNLDLSRDGAVLAIQRSDAQQRNPDIWTYDLRRGIASRLTSDPAIELGPVWSADHKRIVYITLKAAGTSVVSRQVAGTSEQVIADLGDFDGEVIDLSADGRTLLCEVMRPGTRLDVVGIDAATRKMTSLVATRFSESSARFSPDGKWLAYSSDEGGEREVYIQPYPPDGNRWQISSGRGESPRWAAGGRRLFFVGSESRLMSVEIPSSVPMQPGTIKSHRVIGSDDYVVTPDGKEVIVSRTQSGGVDPIVMTLGAFSR